MHICIPLFDTSNKLHFFLPVVSKPFALQICRSTSTVSNVAQNGMDTSSAPFSKEGGEAVDLALLVGFGGVMMSFSPAERK